MQGSLPSARWKITQRFVYKCVRPKDTKSVLSVGYRGQLVSSFLHHFTLETWIRQDPTVVPHVYSLAFSLIPKATFI